MSLDAERLQAAISAVGGGIFYGLFTFAAVVLAGLPPTRADIFRALANALFGVAAGALAGWFLAPALAAFIPFESLREIHAIGFMTGAFAWTLAPFAFAGVKALGARKAREIGQ